MRQPRILLFAAAATLAASPFAVADWPDWRGPTHDGMVPEEAGDLPTEWDEASGKNVVWKTPIHDEGHSTPVILEGKIWITTATKDGKKMYVVCVEQETGKVLLDRLLLENAEPEPLGNPVNNYAAPSCVVEPGRVYVHFGTYGTVCLDSETFEELWRRTDINCRHYRGPGSSPFLYKKSLILSMDGIDFQFVTALSTETGETLWKTERSVDFNDLGPDGKPKAEGDFRKAYSTPVVAQVGGRDQLIAVGSRAAYGYEVETGKEVWKLRYDGFSNAARPVVAGGFALVNTGYGSPDLLAVRLEGASGDITESHVVWKRSKSVPKRSSPLVVGDLIFMVDDGGIATCSDLKTGEDYWRERVEGQYSASPIHSDGKVYFCNLEGQTVVVKADKAFEVIAENTLANGLGSSPAADKGSLYLRTHDTLYRLGE